MSGSDEKKLATVQMVDVGDKPPTSRRAVAEGWVALNEATFAALLAGEIPKGNVIAAAQIAGIQTAKRTSELLPLCHPLGEISGIEIALLPQPDSRHVQIIATVRAFGRTGVEMEALCGVTAAALCVYDMCKALDPTIEIGGIRLREKSGGKSGQWHNPSLSDNS